MNGRATIVTDEELLAPLRGRGQGAEARAPRSSRRGVHALLEGVPARAALGPVAPRRPLRAPVLAARSTAASTRRSTPTRTTRSAPSATRAARASTEPSDVGPGLLAGGGARGGDAAGRVRRRARTRSSRTTRGEWTMQPKVYVTNYPAGDFRAMPALGGGHALLKWVTSFPGNPALGLPTVTGLVAPLERGDRAARGRPRRGGGDRAPHGRRGRARGGRRSAATTAHRRRGRRMRRQRRRDGADARRARPRAARVGRRRSTARRLVAEELGVARRRLARGGARVRRRDHRHARAATCSTRPARCGRASTSR